MSIRKLLASFFCIAVALPAGAHEYWVQGDRYVIGADDNIRAHVRVGQHFKGEALPYFPDAMESIQIHLGSRSGTIQPRYAAYPVISNSPLGDGLNIISLTSGRSELKHDDPEKFREFLVYEGLEWVLARHKERKLPSAGFIETYRRYAKMLVKVGSGEGEDRYLGMPLEWVLLANPYAGTADTLWAQLRWQGKVFAGAQCRVFIEKNDKLDEIVLHTDKEGKIRFPRVSEATYLVSAVHMVEPDRETVKQTRAVWESRWASVTFSAR